MLSIASPITLPFQKVWINCHVTNITISLTCGVYCNVNRLKSTVKNFLHDSIITNDEHVLLIIEDKWLQVIVHMIEFEFLDLLHPKQV